VCFNFNDFNDLSAEETVGKIRVSQERLKNLDTPVSVRCW
jgi:hypothetical protein